MGKSKIGNVITAAGVLLILCAAVLLLYSIADEKQAARQNEETVNKILSLIPDGTNGVPNDIMDDGMPALELNGLDYIGLIGISNSQIRFPVLSERATDRPNVSPYRYGGTVSDGSLVIGGLRPDFLSSCIEANGTVTLTDMYGSRYTYGVTDIEYAEEISEAVFDSDDDLILFSSNKWKRGYTVLRFFRED